MRILYVDDEQSAHINFRYIVKNRKDVSSVGYCFDYASAIDYCQTHAIDCAFLDISLPDKNGIELAGDIVKLQPHTELAFITSYDSFTKEAFQVGGRAYISKPYNHDEMEKLLDLMGRLVNPVEKEKSKRVYNAELSVFAKTFGSFDLLIDGQPVYFKNAKSKELMAFLVHQMGGTVGNIQIFYALWEQQEYNSSTSTYVRRTLRALKTELEERGIGYLLHSRRNSLSLDIKQMNCDAYEMIHGNETARNQYNGEYMSQYAWGEGTIPLLNRIANV